MGSRGEDQHPPYELCEGGGELFYLNLFIHFVGFIMAATSQVCVYRDNPGKTSEWHVLHS